MATDEAVYDLVIVGGAPAGLAAAIRARQLKREVLVIDSRPLPRVTRAADWLSPGAIDLCEACGLTAKSVGATPFIGLTLHSWDFQSSASVEDDELSGWIVARAKLEQALLAAATSAGVTVRAGVALAGVEAHETCVRIELADSAPVCGRIALLAGEDWDEVARWTPVASRPPAEVGMRCLHARGALAKPASAFHVILGTGRACQAATLVCAERELHVTLIGQGDAGELEGELESLLRRAEAAGLIPTLAGAHRVSSRGLTGAALDMDAHVGKRTLLIGGAGGFSAALSAEDLYPGMRSGWIAADVVHRALDASVAQEELTAFDVEWRGELAAYLRMPNADLSLLLPLVFNNEQMSRRVARAFLLGQDF